MTVLGLDCGGSASRWLLLESDGSVRARGDGPGLTGHIFDPSERAVAMKALGGLCRDIRAATPAVDAAMAGITGLSSDVPEARVFADTLAALLSVPAGRIAVHNDLWLAYHAAFRPGKGLLVYAGTGSAACHIDGDGQMLLAGGHGCVIDDAGSGFWIGQAAVRWMMRQADRMGQLPSGPLADALLDRIGGRDWEAVRAFIYANPRSRTADLSLAVAEAAGAGDGTALSILEQAGCELAELATALIERVGLMPVALAGGAASLHPLIFETFERSLGVPDARLAELDPALAAARLARDIGD